MPALKNLLVFLLRFTVLGLALAFVVLLFRPDLMRARSLDRAATPATPPGPRLLCFGRFTQRARGREHLHGPARARPTPRSPIESYMGGDWPLYRERIERSLGSGVIVEANGHIVTNHHVMPDGAAIMVQLSDGRIAQARVVGRDRDTDLAVLQIDLDDLPTIRLGRSDTLRVGDVVLAIGNPVGLSQTVTHGIVSATGRGLRLNAFEDFIQTDAAINVGNSGGALVNVEGELVGINTAVFSRTAGIEGIGFAIPVNLVRGVTDEIVRNGRVIRGWLGILPEDLPAPQARALGLPPGTGVMVLNLYSDSPAHRAGLKPGDVLTHIGELQLTSGPQALATVATMAPGEVVQLRGLRAGRPFRLSARIEERPR